MNIWKMIAVIAAAVVVIVAAVMFFSYVAENSPENSQNLYNNDHNSNSNESTNSYADSTDLPECTGQKFTVHPVDLSEVYDITPLGSLNPPEHTLPTNHMFFHLNAGGSSTETFTLYAPGDVTVTEVMSSTDSFTGDKEYFILFALCENIFGYFNHVKGIEGSLKTAFESTECEGGFYPEGVCKKLLKHQLTAGEEIGNVGSLQGNFDFGAMDISKTLAFANLGRYMERTPYIICPLDLYENADAFYEKMQRTGSPRCGQTNYDIPGTLQGNWFYRNSNEYTGGDWVNHLAFAYDNIDPSTAVISIGGVITDASKLEFTPNNMGTVNRKFSDVTPGAMHCYEGSIGRILVEMTDEDTINIEHQSGTCTGSLTFTNPAVYKR